MANDQQPDSDAYYGNDGGNDEEIDLSFLDESKDED
jgi:hypothetical protein